MPTRRGPWGSACENKRRATRRARLRTWCRLCARGRLQGRVMPASAHVSRCIFALQLTDAAFGSATNATREGTWTRKTGQTGLRTRRRLPAGCARAGDRRRRKLLARAGDHPVAWRQAAALRRRLAGRQGQDGRCNGEQGAAGRLWEGSGRDGHRPASACAGDALSWRPHLPPAFVRPHMSIGFGRTSKVAFWRVDEGLRLALERRGRRHLYGKSGFDGGLDHPPDRLPEVSHGLERWQSG